MCIHFTMLSLSLTAILLETRYRREVDSLKVRAGVITDKKDIAEEFGSSVVGTIGEDLDGVDPCEMVPVCESSFKFDMIEEEEVLKILQGLDPNKWELMG